MINKLDKRLNSIENNISKLWQIQDEVSKVRDDLKAANRTLHTQFDELEVFSKSMSNVSDEFYSH
jgi:predicted  nucleic acid-binding Zn-ribbon protein